jgi:hypothetical protein
VATCWADGSRPVAIRAGSRGRSQGRPPRRGGSPLPASAAGLETCARTCPAPPVRRNPPTPAGRPPGSRNCRPAPHYDVGKTTKRELPLKAKRERAG